MGQLQYRKRKSKEGQSKETMNIIDGQLISSINVRILNFLFIIISQKEAKDKSEKKALSSSKRTPRTGISIRNFTPLGTSKRKLSFDNSPANSTKRVCSQKKRRSPRVQFNQYLERNYFSFSIV